MPVEKGICGAADLLRQTALLGGHLQIDAPCGVHQIHGRKVGRLAVEVLEGEVVQNMKDLADDIFAVLRQIRQPVGIVLTYPVLQELPFFADVVKCGFHGPPLSGTVPILSCCKHITGVWIRPAESEIWII